MCKSLILSEIQYGSQTYIVAKGNLLKILARIHTTKEFLPLSDHHTIRRQEVALVRSSVPFLTGDPSLVFGRCRADLSIETHSSGLYGF